MHGVQHTKQVHTAIGRVVANVDRNPFEIENAIDETQFNPASSRKHDLTNDVANIRIGMKSMVVNLLLLTETGDLLCAFFNHLLIRFSKCVRVDKKR